jgi:hypothetical protein
MNIFKTHNAIVEEYKTYIESFINIRKPHINEAIKEALNGGKLWPHPLIQFNPIYKKGETVPRLIREDILHPSLDAVFSGYRLYQHQVDALTLGAEGKGFIVTSGTGSGKSLTFLGTIFNDLFKKDYGQGVKAILVYPMNALINSQYEEIQKYAKNYEESIGTGFPFTAEKYTGQEGDEIRERIRSNPPDILLTNYMMLELILTRSSDVDVRNSIYSSLKYLVYDELHTFRGRQGSDVALLNRRLRAQCRNEITCMGTSATMVSEGSLNEQKEKVAEVATTFFGSPFSADQVVVEQLEPSLTHEAVSKEAVVQCIEEGIGYSGTYEDLISDPLAQWLEQSVALTKTSDGHIGRNKPKTLEEIAAQLSSFCGLDEDICRKNLEAELERISRVNVEATKIGKKAILPYKLHQFISQTGSVYATLEQEAEKQKITLESGIYDLEEVEKMIYPIVFSRETGQEFFCVFLDLMESKILPREFSEVSLGDEEEEEASDYVNTAGYLIPDVDVWNEEKLADVPGNWVTQRQDGSFNIRKQYRARMPQRIWYKVDGEFTTQPPADPEKLVRGMVYALSPSFRSDFHDFLLSSNQGSNEADCPGK